MSSIHPPIQSRNVDISRRCIAHPGNLRLRLTLQLPILLTQGPRPIHTPIVARQESGNRHRDQSSGDRDRVPGVVRRRILIRVQEGHQNARRISHGYLQPARHGALPVPRHVARQPRNGQRTLDVLAQRRETAARVAYRGPPVRNQHPVPGCGGDSEPAHVDAAVLAPVAEVRHAQVRPDGDGVDGGGQGLRLDGRPPPQAADDRREEGRQPVEQDVLRERCQRERPDSGSCGVSYLLYLEMMVIWWCGFRSCFGSKNFYLLVINKRALEMPQVVR